MTGLLCPSVAAGIAIAMVGFRPALAFLEST